jgi:hypothetical protein
VLVVTGSRRQSGLGSSDTAEPSSKKLQRLEPSAKLVELCPCGMPGYIAPSYIENLELGGR